MKSILSKLFFWDKDQACENIINIYSAQNYCIVNYLYFAPISLHHLFDISSSDIDIPKFKNALLEDYRDIQIEKISSIYKHTLLSWDILLPDGIALQMFYFLAYHKWIKNLNWTDFCPYFLSYLRDKFWSDHINIILYWSYDDVLHKTIKYLKNLWLDVIYYQNWYSNMDWDALQTQIQKKPDCINILLLARSTPDYPIQEIWSSSNISNIMRHKLLVMNQGWTFDFRAGKQKRAPRFIRTIKMEWLWRVISDPQRNIKKVSKTLKIFHYVLYYLLLKKK